MKFLNPAAIKNEKNPDNPKIQMEFDHQEIDRLHSSLTNYLNTRTWNFDDPTDVWDHTLLSELLNFMFKAWEATSPRDPMPIDPALVKPKEPPAEFVPNPPPEDIPTETEFTNP
jgi:hypothetical protein